MKAKWNPVWMVLVALPLMLTVVRAEPSNPAGTANRPGQTAGKTLYTCGMHPWIIQDHPGDCPICGMKLEPIHQAAAGPTPGTATNNAGDSAETIAIDPATIQLMNLQTTTVNHGPLRRTIRTVGTLGYNETAITEVALKYQGWVEKLEVDSAGQLVHRGEPLLEIYSPELYSAEAEYVAVLDATNTPAALALRAAAREKLGFYDLTEAQITRLEQSRTPGKTVEMLAPADGFAIEKNVVQGQMVEAGMKLYRLADLGTVWVYAQVYEQDLPFVQLGQEATVKLASLPDREFRGRVTYVYPDVDERTRTAKVRLEFENPGYFLKPGMFVSAELTSEIEPDALLVPESAVLRSGAKNTVFVARAGGRFDARTVVLGLEAEHDQVEVVQGLRAGEQLVTSGQFMLDSESQLREAVQKMNGSVAGQAAGPATAAESRTNVLSGHDKKAEGLVYVCPMPEHVSIVYDHPGNCPICGMALVPVTPAELKRLQPGGKVLYYTCPMPEHGSVHEDKPGKCPICGMTLIPVMGAQGEAAGAAPATNAVDVAPGAAEKQLYTCPMHPDVIRDHPGQCPKCGMTLVPLNHTDH